MGGLPGIFSIVGRDLPAAAGSAPGAKALEEGQRQVTVAEGSEGDGHQHGIVASGAVGLDVQRIVGCGGEAGEGEVGAVDAGGNDGGAVINGEGGGAEMFPR